MSLDEARIDHAVDHAAPHDDVRLEQLHRDQREPLVEVQQLGHSAGRVPRLDRVSARCSNASATASGQLSPTSRTYGSACLTATPPASPSTMNTRLRLPSPTSLIVQEAGGAAEPGRDSGKPREVVPQVRLMKNSVFVLPGISQ